MDEPLLKEERQKIILDTLRDNNRVTVPELALRFGTSEVTIRRDLSELAGGGKLIRAHRGALKVTPAPPESPVVQRMALEHAWKEAVADAALELVADGDTIFLGSGSTMTLFAHRLGTKKHLTVVTNALNIAADLVAGAGDITVVVTGGVVRAEELSLLGHITELCLPELRYSKVFMGAQALSVEDGWTTQELSEVTTTRRIFSMGAERIILVDHTKLGRSAGAFVLPINHITTLVTDSKADPAFINKAKAKGVSVIIA